MNDCWWVGRGYMGRMVDLLIARWIWLMVHRICHCHRVDRWMVWRRGSMMNWVGHCHWVDLLDT